MQMGLVFFLRMFRDKCNRDYFQCNRNRLHLCCNHPMSDVLSLSVLYLPRDHFTNLCSIKGETATA